MSRISHKHERWLSAALGIFMTAPLMARADGHLNIYNWGNYTSPELIVKFEQQYHVNVTLTDFDSNDTALAKVRQGGSGFDIVVPSSRYVPIWISEGLLLETDPYKMSNFKNVEKKWVDVPFDPGRKYTVPWVWGTTGITVNKSVYAGDPNTSAIFLNPPKELVGKINVVSEMADVIDMTLYYVGGTPCTDDLGILKKARDVLMAAKPKWIAMESDTIDKFAKGDFGAGVNWSGDSLRSRLKNPNIVYGYPKEGYPIWMDNVAVLKDAKNVENARLFQNFIMDPKNAALISTFAHYANAIKGSDKYLPKQMRDAPEIEIPEQFVAAGHIQRTCPPKVQALYTRIWRQLQQ